MTDSVSASRVIDASPEAIFSVLTDPAQHCVIDGSGSLRRVRQGSPKRLELGSKFGMSMRMGLPYPITNQVVEYEQDRRIAWAHFAGHRWRYELEPVEGGTLVTETWDWSYVKTPVKLLMTGGVVPERNRRNMEATLQRLDAHLTGLHTPERG